MTELSALSVFWNPSTRLFYVRAPDGTLQVIGDGFAANEGEANTASNVGTGAGLFTTKVGVNLPFRSLIATTPLAATQNTNDVTFALPGLSGWGSDGQAIRKAAGTNTWEWFTPSSGGEANTSSNAGGTYGLALPKSGVDLPFKGLTAGTNVTITDNGTYLTIAAAGGGGGASPAGSTGELQTNGGGGVFAATTNITGGANFIAFNSSAASGYIRLGSTGSVAQVIWRPSSTDIDIIRTDTTGSAKVTFGDVNNVNTSYLAAFAVAGLYVNGTVAVQANSTQVALGLPLSGSSNKGIRLKRATVSCSGASTDISASSSAESGMITFATGSSPSNPHTVTFPADDGGLWLISNTTAVVIRAEALGGSLNVSVAAGTRMVVAVEGSELREWTAQH